MQPTDQTANDAQVVLDDVVPAAPPPQKEPALADSPTNKEPAMDIHPPHGAIHTKKDFFIHLFTIILGILIALSLDAMLHWIEHRSLVSEARRNLAAEIRRNHKEIKDNLLALRKSQEQVKQVLAVMKDLKSKHQLDAQMTRRLGIEMTGASLYSTSWNAANRSGAITYMSYAEVERYTALYDQQQGYLNLQDGASSPLYPIFELLVLLRMKGDHLKSLPTRDLEEMERTALQALIREEILEQNGRSLNDDYAKFESSEK